MTGECFTKAVPRNTIFTSAAAAVSAAAVAILFMLCCCCHPGLAAVQPSSLPDVVDLLQGLNATSVQSLAGLRYTTGPDNRRPALLLEDNDRHLALPSPVGVQALRILRDYRELNILCSVRQDLDDSGTLLALASNVNNYFLELESSGRRNELRFHYAHHGEVRVEKFPYRLADGRWHKLAVSVSGNQLTVYVDCNRIYRRVIPTIDKPTDPGTLSVYVGQRNRQQALFMGALQDVKIVTRPYGYLLQCPEQESECPSCANFQALERKVQEMSNMYKQLTNQLKVAETRLSDLEQCECLRYCYDNGTQRKEGEEWKRDKCKVCRCQNGEVECHHKTCPPVDCDNPVYRDGECCPTCNMHCVYSGKHYNHGDGMSPRVCVTCTCHDGQMLCKRQDVKKTCPKLNCPPEERIEIHGQCCPVCNGTDFCGQGHSCHSNASCINLATKYACQCKDGFEGDGHVCQDINECSLAGGSKGHHCSSNTVCVNTPGSYRCDCVKGHTRLDSYECKDYDECMHGVHKCHHLADCANVRGNYSCTCKDGYQGDGFHCKPSCEGDCRNGGKCIAPNTCECRHGYMGSNCEFDIDECALGISRCHGSSVCINMPGRYHCDCLEGYHSSWPDNQQGDLCLDIDECKGEGQGHTCHESMHCKNTEGGYQCVCDDPNECTRNCIFEGQEHINGDFWISRMDMCQECICEAGRTICHETRCNCEDASVNLQCCPHCNKTSTCIHQEFPVVYQSGDTWFYQCQKCQCLEGEIDCWQFECPEISCADAVKKPGDCCPVCADSNPCSALTLEMGGQDFSHLTCNYLGREYVHGDEWHLKSDTCTTCQCKAGHICCSFSQSCSHLL